MVYETFLMQISSQIQEALKDQCRVRLIRVQKNNGLLLDGLCMERDQDPISPTIYLNSYFCDYQKGLSLEKIRNKILETYQSCSSLPELSPTSFSDFSFIKTRIVFRLVNAASNQALLEEIPHIPLLDLAVVFCLFLSDKPDSQMTALIRNSHLETWGLPVRDLFSIAMENTPRLLPPSLKSLSSVMQEILHESLSPASQEDELEELYETPLYVLTNQAGIHGAACLLYPHPLKNFADARKSDVLILPSSIHEVLITADSPDIDYDALSQMVMEINRSDVPLEDRLSNQVYRYSRKTGRISAVSHAPESVGISNP